MLVYQRVYPLAIPLHSRLDDVSIWFLSHKNLLLSRLMEKTTFLIASPTTGVGFYVPLCFTSPNLVGDISSPTDIWRWWKPNSPKDINPNPWLWVVIITPTAWPSDLPGAGPRLATHEGRLPRRWGHRCPIHVLPRIRQDLPICSWLITKDR